MKIYRDQNTLSSFSLIFFPLSLFSPASSSLTGAEQSRTLEVLGASASDCSAPRPPTARRLGLRLLRTRSHSLLYAFVGRIMSDRSDSETTFRIEVKIDGYFNKQNIDTREYVKGRTLKWIVDSDRFSLCHLISDLSSEISWGSCQTPNIWMFDKNEGMNVQLVSEAQILEMFMMYQEERKIDLLVIVCDSDEVDQGVEHDIYVGFNDENMYGDDVEGVANYAVHEVSINPEPILEDNVDEELSVDDAVHTNSEHVIVYDPSNPKIELKALFPDVGTFRKALRHFAIKNEFEVQVVKSDKKRFIGRCKHSTCPWRIRASRVQNSMAFMVKVLPHAHTCPSTTMVDGKMASQSWVAEWAGEWLRKNPMAGAKEVKNKLEDEFHVKVTYNKAWMGRKDALDNIHGSWEGSFQELFNFKAEVEMRCPGSLVVVDHKDVGNKKLFTRIFVALKPCIDGFLQGCRPYLGVDSTHMTGKFKGQLAAACGIDGHTWLFPVAYGVFDTETTDNWTWFMTQLNKAVGSPPGLAISSDACMGLATAIASAFPEAEHRECMRHLMKNFNMKFHGDVFDKNMWPAATTYTIEKCQHHLAKIKKEAPQAIAYLDTYHKQKWCRSEFSELTKCDYINNNISESFNSWIKDLKELHVVDLVDQIRGRLMVTFAKRRMVGSKLEGAILPSVMKQLNAKSRNMRKVTIDRGGDTCAEVKGMDPDGTHWRIVVDLEKRACACGEWQLTGLPCMHAIAFICSLRGARIEDYVHEYYSLDKFKAAYASVISPLNDKSKWVQFESGFKVHPPDMKRPPGRPRKERIPSCLELGSKRHQCKRCGAFGHQARTCKAAVPNDGEAPVIKKRKRRTKKKT